MSTPSPAQPAPDPVAVAPPHPVTSPRLSYLVAAALVPVAFLVAPRAPGTGHAGAALLLAAAALAVLFAGVGSTLCGRWAGVIINGRNLMSLSRMQAVLWTVILLAGFATVAFMRLKAHGAAGALDIQVDWQLWALMGISTSSLVGSPFLTAAKADKKPTDAAAQRTGRLTGETQAELDANRQGTLYANPSPLDARMEDLFQGDEVGNTAHVDLAKLQMFCFTIMTAAVYCAVLVAKLRSPAALDGLPPLSDGMVALLGISHAGYLTSKAADHTPTQPG